jgi:hypothetical protein
MGTGSGTFAIAWSQSELDGQADPPLDLLAVGAGWSWSGTAARLDGPQDVLRLDGAEGADELRRRAARTVARLVGQRHRTPEAPRPEADAPLSRGFAVTDGRRLFRVSLLGGDRRDRLLAFPGALPAPGAEHWVTAVDLPAPDLLPQAVVCFAAGTRIRTPSGEAAVEDLRPGDLVCTRDDGARPVEWIGSRRISGARLQVSPGLRPVRIRAGALGPGLPASDLLVSPQHRLLVGGRAAEALFGTAEVLVEARDLIDDRGIGPARSLREITYVHLMLARHQVLLANGLPAESFHPAGAALAAIEPVQRAMLLRRFPELDRDPFRYGPHARRALTRAEAAVLRYRPAALPRPAGA